MESEGESLVATFSVEPGTANAEVSPAGAEELGLGSNDSGLWEGDVAAAARDFIGLEQQGTREEKEQQNDVKEAPSPAALILARANKTWPAWRVSCMVASESRLWQFLSIVTAWVNALLIMYTASLPREQALRLHPVTDVFEMWFFVEFLIAALGKFAGWWNDGVLCLDAAVAFSCLVGCTMRYCAEVEYGQVYLFISSMTLLKVWRTYRCFEPRNDLQGLFFGIDVLAWCEDLGKWRPISVLVSSIRESKFYVLCSSMYVGMVFLSVGVLCNGLVGKLDAHGNPSLQEVLEEKMSTVPRALLTLFEAAHGGLRWRLLIFPFLEAEEGGWKPPALLILVTLCVTKFCLWNLVFGVYVRDAVTVARQFDQQKAAKEAQELFDSDNAKKEYNLREIFDAVDLNQDGYISRDELWEQERNDPTIYNIIGGDPAAVQLVHAALDYEHSGLVPISELIYGIQRVKGSSKSFDMRSIDYKQKALMHTIGLIKKSTQVESKRLFANLTSTETEVQELHSDITQSLTRINNATQLLQREIGKMDGILARHHQHLQENAALDSAKKDVDLAEELQETRRLVETRVRCLDDQVNELALAAKMEAISAAGPATVNALRLVVRKRLEAQLQPWLEEEVARCQAEPAASLSESTAR